MTKLTAKQKRFCEEYLVDLNATQAAIRAGYSAKTAKEQGYDNLTKLHIGEYLQSLQKDLAERTEVSQEWVIEKLKAEAEFKGKGSSHSARVAALEKLGKHLGMFTDKIKVENKNELEIVIID